MKRCPTCKTEKDDSEFHRCSRTRDGLQWQCKSCARKFVLDNWQRVKASNYNWRELNPERHKANQRRAARSPQKKAYGNNYRLENREACNARVAKWSKENRERKSATNAAWHARNFEHRKEQTRKRQIANRDKECAKSARHRAAKMNACPPWADLKTVGYIYAEAQRISRETGIQHHVDHIYPLQSKWLCGLHIPINLQVIPGKDNVIKSNKHWPGWQTQEEYQSWPL